MNRKQKARYLIDRGYVKLINDEPFLSSEAVALLSGTVADEWRAFAEKSGPDVTNLPEAFVKKAIRGAKETQAAVGSEDMLDVLYAKAVA